MLRRAFWDVFARDDARSVDASVMKDNDPRCVDLFAKSFARHARWWLRGLALPAPVDCAAWGTRHVPHLRASRLTARWRARWRRRRRTVLVRARRLREGRRVCRLSTTGHASGRGRIAALLFAGCADEGEHDSSRRKESYCIFHASPRRIGAATTTHLSPVSGERIWSHDIS